MKAHGQYNPRGKLCALQAVGFSNMKIDTIGMIGLGIMGKPMAMNLILANYKLAFYARREDSLQPFKSYPIRQFKTPAELAGHCDITITMVSDTPDVKEIITSKNGIIGGAGTGHLVIDMSTISPKETRILAKQLSNKRIEMLDAPVSGGEQGAIEGTLSIMVGGKEDLFHQALPVLRILGNNITHVGDHGAGQVAKACNQILVAQTISAVAEAFLLARSSGVEPHKVREALMGGFAYSRILEVHGKRMLDSAYRPGFKAALHHKDLKIALENAKENGISVPGTDLAADYLEKIVESGNGNLDSAAIAKIIFGETN